MANIDWVGQAIQRRLTTNSAANANQTGTTLPGKIPTGTTPPKKPPPSTAWRPGTKPNDYISGDYKTPGKTYKAWKTASGYAPDFGKATSSHSSIAGPGTPYSEVTKKVPNIGPSFPGSKQAAEAAAKAKAINDKLKKAVSTAKK